VGWSMKAEPGRRRWSWTALILVIGLQANH